MCYDLASGFASRRARVILASTTLKTAEMLAALIGETTESDRIESVELDLNNPDRMKVALLNLAMVHRQIDIL